MSSSCSTKKIACSYENTLEVATPFKMYESEYFRKHSRRNLGGTIALINLFLLLHSCM
jgi:hypothetical protein